jgi:hypothetical protein
MAGFSTTYSYINLVILSLRNRTVEWMDRCRMVRGGGGGGFRSAIGDRVPKMFHKFVLPHKYLRFCDSVSHVHILYLLPCSYVAILYYKIHPLPHHTSKNISFFYSALH